MNHQNPNRTTDPETLVQCPYDKTHMIRVLRWPRHIIKCRKNHPTEDLRTCPFNARHEVPAVELRHHISMCPDQVIIHDEILQERRKRGEVEGILKGNTDVPPYNASWPDDHSGEDWDAEYRRHPVIVDPVATSSSTSIDQTGMKRAQRREYRKLLKQRYERVQAGENVDDLDVQIKALARGVNEETLEKEESRVEAPKMPRMPHGPPRIDTMSQITMNGVRKDTASLSDSGPTSRLAAKFNNTLVGLGRGVGTTQEQSQVEKRYEILAKLSAGRGGAKKPPSQ